MRRTCLSSPKAPNEASGKDMNQLTTRSQTHLSPAYTRQTSLIYRLLWKVIFGINHWIWGLFVTLYYCNDTWLMHIVRSGQVMYSYVFLPVSIASALIQIFIPPAWIVLKASCFLNCVLVRVTQWLLEGDPKFVVFQTQYRFSSCSFWIGRWGSPFHTVI